MFSFFYYSFFFFFNDPATTEIYTLSLHDALPISAGTAAPGGGRARLPRPPPGRDRKSTRLNSSHDQISYAVFCLKKKKKSNDSLRSSSRQEQKQWNALASLVDLLIGELLALRP